MPWTAQQRDFFFGDLDRFVQVYCSAHLKGLMGIPGDGALTCEARLRFDSLRRAPAELDPRLENSRDWTHWRGEEGKASYLYRTPIDLHDEFVPENHPLHESHQVARLLAWIGDVHPGQHPHSILGKLENHRNAAEPRDHSVIYPRLLEPWRRLELQSNSESS